MVWQVLLYCAVGGLSSCTIYLLLVLVAARRFRTETRDTAGAGRDDVALPPVSVLKPLCGAEPRLEENLESFFRQNYPDFELVFGARHDGDAALEIVNALARKYPQVRIKIVLSGEPAYPNAKVYLLEKMQAAASFAYLVITDSDVRVAADCLRQVIAPLLDSDVGLVTCLYRGMPSGGLWPLLEALGMSVEMSSGVLVADLLEGMKFALGPTMAIRQDVLEDLGGVGVLGDYCADDFVLGRLTDAAGKRVLLSRHVIEHVVLNRSASDSIRHQVRWMKSARFSRPAGHLGTGLTFAMPFGLLGAAGGMAAGHWRLAIGLLSFAILNRVVQSIAVGWGVVRDPRSLWFCWLYPLRDLLGFFIWCASFLGAGIVWRGERYQLRAGGKMAREAAARLAAQSSPSITVD